jgi:hypothetical protein
MVAFCDCDASLSLRHLPSVAADVLADEADAWLAGCLPCR